VAYAAVADLKQYLDILNQDTFTAVAATDLLTVTKPQIAWNTGDPVTVSTTGTLPAGLAASTVYYVIHVADLTLKLATSSALATAGTAIDITTDGTGTHTIKKQLHLDDDLLEDLLTRAQARVDQETRRTFEAAADGTHYFDAVDDVDGRVLFLDEDLCSITSITNNGTVLTSADYVTEPRNETPYWGIRLKKSSSQSWTFSSTPEDAIVVVGKWAYSEAAPDDIVHWTLRLAGYYYKQRDAQVYDVTASPEMGQITIPQGMPRDVREGLKRYKKVGI